MAIPDLRRPEKGPALLCCGYVMLVLRVAFCVMQPAALRAPARDLPLVGAENILVSDLRSEGRAWVKLVSATGKGMRSFSRFLIDLNHPVWPGCVEPARCCLSW